MNAPIASADFAGERLVGRGVELAEIDGLLARARRGASGTLIIGGVAGIGKTALLAETALRAGGFRVLRTAGVESESRMPYAGLHALIRPVAERIEALPPPQRAAIAGAIGIGAEDPVSMFVVGVACLTLLAGVAEEQPLLLLIDDANWLDDPSAVVFKFVLRRLKDERIAALVAARGEPGQSFDFQGARRLRVTGLGPEEAVQLLAAHFDHLSNSVREQLIDECGGNPLALLTVPTLLTAAQLAGTSPLGSELPLGERLTHSYAEALRSLPPDTARLLLLAAADDSLDVEELKHALGQDGRAVGDLSIAEAAELVSIDGGHVRFRHPLVRSAIYQSATAADREAAHRALAVAFAGSSDPDRSLWHRARAAPGIDEDLAAALEAAAKRMALRRSPGAGAAALDESARLSPTGPQRARRLVAAARAYLDLGKPAHVEARLDEAESSELTERARAEIALLRASLNPISGAYREALVQAAERIGDADPAFAAEMLAFAVRSAQHDDEWTEAVSHCTRLLALDLPPASAHRQWAQSLLAAVAPAGSSASSSAPTFRLPDPASPNWLLWPPQTVIELGGGEADAVAQCEFSVHVMRTRGDVFGLMGALLSLGYAQIRQGQWSSAAAHLTEALTLARQSDSAHYIALADSFLARLAALRGEDDECRERARESEALAPGSRLVTSCAAWALALLDLGRGRPQAAFDRLSATAPLPTWPNDRLSCIRASGDLAEAAILCGRPDSAALVLDGLERWAGGDPHPWIRLVIHRCRGLIAKDAAEAEGHFHTALDTRGGESRPFQYARALLLYGEWLRRQKRKLDARSQLSAAVDIFDRLGAQPWSERARRELRAAGVPAGRREPQAVDRLTPQELHIARLAAKGMTSPEIAAHLFLSPRTVSVHLYRIFPKLGISSRAELREINLADGPSKTRSPESSS